jgi:hypothetical protein
LGSPVYTRGRVAFLLSLAHRDAIDEDACQPDSLSRCTQDGPGSPTTHAEWDPLFAIAEWNDVRAAKERVLERGRMAEAELALELRVHGHTNGEIAELLRSSAATAWRRAGALLEMILDELGGEAEPPAPAKSQVEACLICALRPRARLRARYRYVRGRGKVVSRPERQSALCEVCLPEARRPDVVRDRPWRSTE